MASAKIRAIIFDIGRVLIRIDLDRSLGGLAEGVSLSPQELWSAIEKDPRWTDWQEGRISPQDWHQHLARRLGSSLTYQQFVEIWNRALHPNPIQDSEFLEKLAKCYRLAVLSNTDPVHVTHMEASFDFLRLFPVRIYSCKVGASKPNPLIYREALRACKVHAEETVYIDDIAAYAEAATRLGMKGLVYESPEKLQSDLKSLGIELC